MCGSKENLEIHHTTATTGRTSKGGFSGGTLRLADWKRNMDKIMLLCKKCHYIFKHGRKT
jgi:hypothetical protein